MPCIGPLGSSEFAADFRKTGAFCRVDVGIDPYRVLRKFAAAPADSVRFSEGRLAHIQHTKRENTIHMAFSRFGYLQFFES